MLKRRPDLVAEMVKPLYRDRRGEVPEGQKPFFEIPVFNWHKGFLTAIYQRQYIDSAQRFADAPRISPQLKEALDLFDALTNDPRLHHFMEFKPGDVQILNNFVMLHSRREYEDWPEENRRRHLLRLAVVQNHDAIGERQRLLLVMGDEHCREPGLLMHFA